jgi:hypothetical protein
VLQVSTGFKQRILGPESFDQIFNGGAIAIYSGQRPDTADDPATGQLLGHFTTNGGAWGAGNLNNGLTWGRQGPFVIKPVTEIWRINPIATSQATWFRILGPQNDIGSLSFVLPRIDGDISSVPQAAEMRLLNPVLQVGTTRSLDYFVFTIPPVVGA